MSVLRSAWRITKGVAVGVAVIALLFLFVRLDAEVRTADTAALAPREQSVTNLSSASSVEAEQRWQQRMVQRAEQQIQREKAPETNHYDEGHSKSTVLEVLLGLVVLFAFYVALPAMLIILVLYHIGGFIDAVSKCHAQNVANEFERRKLYR